VRWIRSEVQSTQGNAGASGGGRGYEHGQRSIVPPRAAGSGARVFDKSRRTVAHLNETIATAKIDKIQQWRSTMSTDFAPVKKIAACDLFDNRLEEFGVREHIKPDETTETKRCLTDGRNYLWVHIGDEGLISCISRYGANAPGKILSAVAEAFDTDIVSEYEPQFWGFDTQGEWDAAMENMSRESTERFYVDLVSHLRGEPNDIRPGTIGMTKAEIARKLAEKDPALLSRENKDKFLSEINSIYERDHTVFVTLSEEEAFANDCHSRRRFAECMMREILENVGGPQLARSAAPLVWLSEPS
jgi:hypothetical protein